ncbi:MAG: translation initiation factor IF-2 N-terminal domain-containing protein, partial [bacterium]|nr:translation initiation factor IF-2 N-terminal domain-containing protein [bacterium]
MATTTGKVRIFELAKEVGLTSKELIALFNERLGGIFEAKNQLSVVPDHIADLVRSVLLKPAPAARKAPAAKPAAPAAAAPVAPEAPVAEAPAAPASAAPAKPAAPEAPPIPRLKPVTSAPRTAAPKAP